MYAKAKERFGDDMDAVLEAYQPGQDPRKFLDGFQNASLAGKMGNRTALENSSVAAYLTEEQREMAYEFGLTENYATSAEYATITNHGGLSKENQKTVSIHGARITDLYGDRAEAHAYRYYSLVRKMTSDVRRIAAATGFSEREIQHIKDYIFNEKHDLGDGEPRRFDPSFAMAQSWQRLVNGTPEPHDITLIRHELMERSLVEKGMSQYEAHIAASEVYNYAKESDEYYGDAEKY